VHLHLGHLLVLFSRALLYVLLRILLHFPTVYVCKSFEQINKRDYQWHYEHNIIM